jgi:hypothetical protein
MQMRLSALVQLVTRAAVGPPLSRLCSTIRAGGDGLSAQWWIDRKKAVPIARAARRFAGAKAAMHRSAANLKGREQGQATDTAARDENHDLDRRQKFGTDPQRNPENRQGKYLERVPSRGPRITHALRRARKPMARSGVVP